MDGARRILSESTLTSNIYLNGRNILSQRQKDELNASVLQYLKPILASEPEVYDLLNSKLTETNSGTEKYGSLVQKSNIPENYLEKKWSTVLRLQRNIQELESKIESLEQDAHGLKTQLEERIMYKNPEDTSIKLGWLPSTIKSTLTYHTSPITAVIVHPFNPYLVTASQDGMIVFWNMLDLSEPINILKNAHSKSINSLVFQPNSSILVSCSSDQIIKLWNLENIEDVKIPMKILTGHEHIISSVAISPVDSNILVSASRDKSIRVWDLTSGWALHTINIHSNWVRSVDLQGDYVLSGSSDTSVRLTYWPTQTAIGLCLGHQQVVEDVKLFPKLSNVYLDKLITVDDTESDLYNAAGFKYAVSCGRDKLIKIWRLPVPQINAVNGMPSANRISPYGKCILEIKGHQSWVRKLQIHYSGRYLISSSDDNTIKIWDLQDVSNPTLEPVKTLTGHQSFVNTISLVAPKNGELTDNNIRCYLVSGSADNSVNIWV